MHVVELIIITPDGLVQFVSCDVELRFVTVMITSVRPIMMSDIGHRHIGGNF